MRQFNRREPNAVKIIPSVQSSEVHGVLHAHDSPMEDVAIVAREIRLLGFLGEENLKCFASHDVYSYVFHRSLLVCQSQLKKSPPDISFVLTHPNQSVKHFLKKKLKKLKTPAGQTIEITHKSSQQQTAHSKHNSKHSKHFFIRTHTNLPTSSNFQNRLAKSLRTLRNLKIATMNLSQY